DQLGSGLFERNAGPLRTQVVDQQIAGDGEGEWQRPALLLVERFEAEEEPLEGARDDVLGILAPLAPPPDEACHGRGKLAIQLEAPTERLRARAVALFEHLHVIVAGRELHDRSGENVDAAGGDRAGDIEDGDGVEVAIELELLRDVALALEPGEEPPAAHEIPSTCRS